MWTAKTIFGLYVSRYELSCSPRLSEAHWFAQAFCWQFAAVKGEKITDDDDDQTDKPAADDDNIELSNADREIEDYLNTFIRDVEQDLKVDMDESRPVVTEEEAKVGRYAIHKVWPTLIKCLKMAHWSNTADAIGKENSLLHEAIREACRQHDLDEVILICAVTTWWNTIADMLERGLYLQDILNDICDQYKFNQSRGLRLCQYALTDDEWDLLDQCSDYLEVRGYHLWTRTTILMIYL